MRAHFSWDTCHFSAPAQRAKQMILGTTLGKIAMSARDSMEMLRAAFFRPEVLGMLSNDQLAITLVTSLCKPNRIFLDVGAHIGSVIAAVARHDPSIRIIAVEAMPEKIISLRRTFPSVEFHGCAAGNVDGEISFFVNIEESGYSSLAHPSSAKQSRITEIQVPIRRIDGLISSQEVDVIKIDVEGAELGVLQGAENLLAKSRPSIMFESGPTTDDGLGFTKEAMWEWLMERNYVVVVPNRVAHNDELGLNRDGFVESHLYPRRTTNYFALPRERRIEIRDTARRILNISVA